MQKKIGRKFMFAIFCAALCIASIILFCIFIEKEAASLLITLIAAPCLGIIATVIGVEGIKDIKIAKPEEK